MVILTVLRVQLAERILEFSKAYAALQSDGEIISILSLSQIWKQVSDK